MMFFMVLDVETTGLITSKPYIVSIAVKIFETRERSRISRDGGETQVEEELLPRNVEVSEVYDMYHIVKPWKDDFEIPKESTMVHGISTEQARKEGVSIETVIQELHQIFDRFPISTIVAHNISFDIGVLSLQVYRFDRNLPTLNDRMYYLTPVCTMKQSKDLLKIVARTKTTNTMYYKYPKLRELYEHFFPRETFEEHNAKADVIACARCFIRMKYGFDHLKVT
jgi:DNA polymerase III epsilon subunit-like protein